METTKTKFDIWWNKPKVKRVYGILYSIGAAVVIIGALFKIRHLPFANEVLTAGMITEAILFALSAFDKPHKEFDWNNVFDFETSKAAKLNAISEGNQMQPTKRSVDLNYTESINDDDVKKLSLGIKNLTETAKQLSTISTASDISESFTETIDKASKATKKFTQSQESLSASLEQLQNSYLNVSTGMEIVDNNTKNYATKIDDINKNLASINTIYEIQLKNIHSQSEGLTSQSEALRNVSSSLSSVDAEIKKMKLAAISAVEESENFKNGAMQLSKQVADLNKVYGNMLNALN